MFHSTYMLDKKYESFEIACQCYLCYQNLFYARSLCLVKGLKVVASIENVVFSEIIQLHCALVFTWYPHSVDNWILSGIKHLLNFLRIILCKLEQNLSPNKTWIRSSASMQGPLQIWTWWQKSGNIRHRNLRKSISR